MEGFGKAWRGMDLFFWQISARVLGVLKVLVWMWHRRMVRVSVIALRDALGGRWGPDTSALTSLGVTGVVLSRNNAGFRCSFWWGLPLHVLINTIKSRVGTDVHNPILHLNKIKERSRRSCCLPGQVCGSATPAVGAWSSAMLPCSEPCNFSLAVAPLLELLRVAGGSCRQQEGSSCHIPLPNGVSYRALL